MKKVLLGMMLGIILCGISAFILLPKVEKAGYDSGYAAGNKDGIAAGTTAGIAQGITELKAIQKRQQDSVAQVIKKQEDARRAAIAKRRVKPAPIQNWHVIDGKIADPVVADNKPAKEPAGLE